MSEKVGRPVEFTDAKRETYCSLVGVGLSRRQAAEYLGIAPSTPVRCAQRDDEFAERLRDAEMQCEFKLMERMQRQCERSWRACVWLLEQTHPDRYGKGKNNASTGPTAEQLFEGVLAIIDRVVDNESLREQLTGQIDQLMREDFNSDEDTDFQEGDKALAGLRSAANARPVSKTPLVENTAAAAMAPQGSSKLPPTDRSASAPAAQVCASSQSRQRRSDRRHRLAHRRPLLLGASAPSPIGPIGIEDLFGDGGRSGPLGDFCNTSPVRTNAGRLPQSTADALHIEGIGLAGTSQATLTDNSPAAR